MEMRQNPSSGETMTASTAMDALSALEWRRTCSFMGERMNEATFFITDDCLLHILLIIIDLFCRKFPSGGVVGKTFLHMGVLRSS